MRAGIGKTSRVAITASLAVWAIVPPAAAQDSGSVSDYRLPEPTQTNRPTVQGPVDPDNPFGTPARTPTPAPTPAPAPTIALPPPVSEATPRPAPTPRTRPTQTPRATAPTPQSSPSPEAARPLESSPPPKPVQPAPEFSDSAAADLPATAAPAGRDDGSDWLIPGLVGAALLGAGAFLFLRRRRPNAEDEPVVHPVPAPVSPPPPVPTPVPAAPAAPKPAFTPPSGAPSPATPTPAEPVPIATVFTAKAVRLSLVYATLQYELEVGNAGTEPLHHLQVRADLASAHGSIPASEQLAPSPAAMEAHHAIEGLAPGETVALKGEVRVPLQQIRPVTKGAAQFMVPLVRFCILAPNGAAVRRVFTAGPHDPGSNAIASVRLDAGPRNLRDLTAREIEAARSFALDPAGAQG